MGKSGKTPADPVGLRQSAEKHLLGKAGIETMSISTDESQRLVHELQVHQIELEMQNEELKRTRNELERSLEKYSNLYEFAPVGYVTIGRDRVIRAINLTGADLLEIERSRLVDRRLEAFISRDSRTVFADFLEKVFAGDKDETCEIRIENEGKPDRFLQVRAVIADSGEECLAAFFNVTGQKKLEQRLVQTQKMESVGLLAGGIAHDFNNMLTAIIGYGEAIRDNAAEGDDHLKENIEQVLNAAKRAADLTGRLLAFSRKQVTRPRPVHVDAVVENIGKLIRRVIGADIEYSYASSGGNPLVMADAGQLEMALLNLATNARDAMPEGGCLRIATDEVIVENGRESLYDLPSPGKFVRITVSDTGKGIAEESLERLFEPFYTTKGAGEGTGLGLSIVHGIAKQHGGSVQVDSLPGNGATFNIYLPSYAGRFEHHDPDMKIPPVGGSETILYVEDEELVRLYTGKMLAKAGYRVIAASDGDEALERFRENGDISLVISDVIMPRKTGPQLWDDIKKTRSGLKVIFITGYSPDIMALRGIEDHDIDYVMKPFSKNELLRRIREVLDRK